jgi:hypothetical protein
MCTGILLVPAGMFADVDKTTSSLMEHERTRNGQSSKLARRCMQTKCIQARQSNLRRCSNLPLTAVSLSKWRMQERISGIGSTPPGTATRSSRLSLWVVVRLSSASQRRCNKALGVCGRVSNFRGRNGVLARQPAMTVGGCVYLPAVQRVPAGFGCPSCGRRQSQLLQEGVYRVRRHCTLTIW